MALQPQITALAQAVGADVKALRTDVTALQSAAPGGGASGPTGAETIALAVAPVPGTYTQLTAAAQVKVVRAMVNGHTLRLPDPATVPKGAMPLVLTFSNRGCKLSDFSGLALPAAPARSTVICAVVDSGWKLSVMDADSKMVAAGEVTAAITPVNTSDMSSCALDAQRMLLVWHGPNNSSGCRVVKILADGSAQFGTTVQFGEWGNGAVVVAALTPSKAVGVVSTSGGKKSYSYAIDIADMAVTVTQSTAAIVPDTLAFHTLQKLDSTRFLMVWRNTAGTVHTTMAQCFVVTSNTVTTALGTPTVLQTGNLNSATNIAQLSASTFAVTLVSAQASNQYAICMVTVSGTYDTTASAATSLGGGSGSPVAAIPCRIDDTAALVLFKHGYSNSGVMHLIVSRYNGTAFVNGARMVVELDSLSNLNMCALEGGGYMLAYPEQQSGRFVVRMAYLDRGAITLGPTELITEDAVISLVLSPLAERSAVALMRWTSPSTEGAICHLRNPA